jgi:hypothetical protein
MGSWYDRDLIVSTMQSNGFDRVATAKLFGCHPVTITHQMQLAAGAEGKPYVNQKIRGKRATGKPSIRWGHEALMKLTTILAREVVPPNKDIAIEMGVSLAALQTAMSRFNLSPHHRSKNVKRPDYRKDSARTNNRQLRNCLTCDKMFGSQGIHNRMCQPCGGIGSVEKEMI